MEILSKQEVRNKIGKPSFWNPQTLVNKVHYASGIAPYDEITDGSIIDEYPLVIKRHPNGIQIDLSKGFSSNRIALLDEEIGRVVLETADQVIHRKERSIVGRALAGGFLFGPVGAVVGGMTGLRDKKVDITPDSFLVIEVTTQEAPLVFTVKEKDRGDVTGFFNGHLAKNFEVV